MSSSNLQALSQHTGLSEAQLKKSAEDLVANSAARVKLLSSLDAALVDASTAKASTMEAFQALSTTTSREPHRIEDPTQAYVRSPASGFAAPAAGAPKPGSDQAMPSPAELDKASKSGRTKLKGGLMSESELLNAGPSAPGGGAPDTAGAQGQVDGLSRDIQFEMIKNEVQKMSQAQQALSNMLSAMHEQAMTAIRNVKA